MFTKHLVAALGVVAALSFVFTTHPQANTHSAFSRVVTSTGQSVGKARYKIDVNTNGGTPISKARDMVAITAENLAIQANDQISVEIQGPDNTIQIGNVADATPTGLTLLDPKGKGKVFKTAKGATLDSFTKAKAIFSVNRGRLSIRLNKGALTSLPREQAVNANNKKASESNVAFTLRVIVLRGGNLIDLPFTTNFTVKSKFNTKKSNIKSMGKSQ